MPKNLLSQPETINNSVIEFDFTEQPSKMDRSIIKTIQDKSLKADSEQPAHFLAEQKNRTQIQTRAEKSGKFQEHKSNKPTDFEAYSANQFGHETNQYSQSEYKLPNDMQTGHAVNLNTDADIYASFYNRVTDLFYIRWAQKLDLIWSRLSDETKRKLVGNNWATDVEIILDSTGHYQQGLVMKKSGFTPFDSAAIFGFKDANYFPNPPKGKVDPDGHIRLKYRIFIQVR